MVASKSSASSGGGETKSESSKSEKSGGKSKTAPGLGITPEHIWGIRRNVAESVQYVDQDVVIYPSGSYLVFHNTKTHEQQLISLAEEGIPVALGLSAKK